MILNYVLFGLFSIYQQVIGIMKDITLTLEDLQPVPENYLYETVAQQRPDEESAVKNVLTNGHILRMAGLTPVYFYCEGHNALLVTSQEKMDHKLH